MTSPSIPAVHEHTSSAKKTSKHYQRLTRERCRTCLLYCLIHVAGSERSCFEGHVKGYVMRFRSISDGDNAPSSCLPPLHALTSSINEPALVFREYEGGRSICQDTLGPRTRTREDQGLLLYWRRLGLVGSNEKSQPYCKFVTEMTTL